MEKNDGAICSDDGDADFPCGNSADCVCVKCGQHFCWSHVINYESEMVHSDVEPGDYCRSCFCCELRRLDEIVSRLKDE